MPASSETAVDRILSRCRTFAVVDASPSRGRPSHGVRGVLRCHRYTVVPVNPHATEILGLPCYPDLASVPESVEVVGIFRRSEAAGAHVELDRRAAEETPT